MCLTVIYSVLLYGGLILAAFGGWESYRAIRIEAKGKRLALALITDLAALKAKIPFVKPPTQTVSPDSIHSGEVFGTAHIELTGVGTMTATGELNLSEFQRLEKRVENAEKEADRREQVRQKEAEELRNEMLERIGQVDLRGREAQAKLDQIDAEALNIQMRGILYVALGLFCSILATVLDTLFTIEHSALFG